MTIKIALAGANGKMSQMIMQTIAEFPELELSLLLVRNKDNCNHSTIKVTDNLASCGADFDILIDFTSPEFSINNAKICQQLNKKIVIGTTGFSIDQKNQLKALSQEIPIILAPNFSVGINIVLKLLEQATKIIGNSADISVLEQHHKHKKDKPSGTALQMIQQIEKQGSKIIDCSSVRIGEVIGEHSVIFNLAGETISINHSAKNRDIFARGALKSAIWLNTKKCGLFDMNDVLEF